MRLLLPYILLFIASLAAHGKVFINHPAAKEGDEVWFRCSFELDELPDSASLSLTTSGYVMAYVNGRIAFPEIIWPYRPLMSITERGDSLPPLRQYARGMATRNIEIRPLLQRGSNVVALWFAPCVDAKALAERECWEATPDTLKGSMPHPASIIHQVSPSLTMKYGKRSNVIADPEASWLCHIASARMTTYGEENVPSKYIDNWKSNDFNFNATWIAAEKSWTEMTRWNTLAGNDLCSARIIEARRNQTTDSKQIFYIPYETSGLLRVTLRSTKKNQLLTVNGMKYICAGYEDEQFFTRFATIVTDSITIENKSKRAFPDIQRVEMIELKQHPAETQSATFLPTTDIYTKE